MPMPGLKRSTERFAPDAIDAGGLVVEYQQRKAPGGLAKCDATEAGDDQVVVGRRYRLAEQFPHEAPGNSDRSGRPERETVRPGHVVVHRAAVRMLDVVRADVVAVPTPSAADVAPPGFRPGGGDVASDVVDADRSGIEDEKLGERTRQLRLLDDCLGDGQGVGGGVARRHRGAVGQHCHCGSLRVDRAGNSDREESENPDAPHKAGILSRSGRRSIPALN